MFDGFSILKSCLNSIFWSFLSCSGCGVSCAVHLGSAEVYLEAGARRPDAAGSAPVCPGLVCRLWLPPGCQHPSLVLSAQLGGPLHCGVVCVSGSKDKKETLVLFTILKKRQILNLICSVMLLHKWVLGLAGFLLPCSPLWFRSRLKPVHIWLGTMVLILSLTSCISGINEKLIFSL